MLSAIIKRPDKLLSGSYIVLLLSIVFYVASGSVMIFFAPIAYLYLLLCISNWKLAYWLLLGCITVSVQFSLSGGALALSLPDEPMCWIFSMLFIMIIAHDPRTIPVWWWNNPVVLIILLQLIWLIVSVMFSTVPLLSIKFLLAKTWYLICFLVFPLFVFKSKKDLVHLFKLLLIPIVVTALVIIVRLGTKRFGFASIGYAVGNLYINHVEFAAVTSIFYPLVWVGWKLTRRSGDGVKKLMAILVVLFLPILFFTYARVAVLAVLFAALVGYAIRLKLVNYILPCIYGIIALMLLYLIPDKKYIDLRPDYTHTIMHSDYSSHILSTFKGRDMSSMERLYRWVAAIRMSADRPIVGFGPHGFVYNYKRYTVGAFKTYVSENTEKSTTHNYFLYMLTEQGWPAMLLYALLNVVVLAQAQRTYHRFQDPFYKYCTLGLAMAFASSFVNNFFSELIETHKAGAFFYLIIALLLILDQKSKMHTSSREDVNVPDIGKDRSAKFVVAENHLSVIQDHLRPKIR